MNVLLQKHGAKHTFKVPEGLRELCTDIAREVLRSQPRNIYCFIADYTERLLITRENAKVAVKVVNNILLGSQAIVAVLYRSGLSLEQIARAAPKIQRAFGAYLDSVDARAAQVCNDATCACEEESKVSLQGILQAAGVSLGQAERAATIIQAAFRGHYERMLLNESQGVIQWQRAAMRTLEILRKAGASQAEASNAAVLIQTIYRGYYMRRNLKMKTMITKPREEKSDEVDTIVPAETIQSMAWLDMMYEESGLTLMRANEAAIVIQRAYKRYRARRNTYYVSRLESTKPMVVEAILKNLHRKVLDGVVSRANIPAEFGSQEELARAGEELQRVFGNRLTRACIMEEDGYDEGELAWPEMSDESFLKLVDDTTTVATAAAARDWKEEGREIEVAAERDGETDVGLA